jgi:hypothetical protein
MNQQIPILGIPHFNRPDLTARCVASIDYPVEQLVIICQGPRENRLLEEHYEAINTNANVKQTVFIQHPNAGVAGSWNEIIKLFPAPWWMISNNDMQFTKGDLEKMATDAWYQEALGDGAAGKLYGNHGASWFVITKRGVQTVGWFDENIYPAYLEDCDWARRADLLKVRRANVPDVHAIHGDGVNGGSCTIMSDPNIRGQNGNTHGGNFAYYDAKWGGKNEQETFATPFNDPNWPVWAWRYDPDFRARQQWTH